MATTIKISELTNIGTNISHTTLVPVVNMTTSPVTQKANIQSMGNYILENADGNIFSPALFANTVTENTQPNITSVGTLTGLNVDGNIVLQSSGIANIQINSNSNVTINTDSGNANLQFKFNAIGTFTSPGNISILGNRLNVGPYSEDVSGVLSPIIVVCDNNSQFVQTIIQNLNPVGSADVTAQGTFGDDTQGWVDMGMTGPEYFDPNYTVSGPGDGYLFAQAYANGVGGNLILATGENGNANAIIFATGGFKSSDTIALFEGGNNALRFAKTGGGIIYGDDTKQDTAWTGNVPLANVTGTSNLVQWTTVPVSNISSGTPGQAAYDSGGNLFICVDINTWSKFLGTTSW